MIEQKAIVTDIKRFSLNDGRGIRTCVFLQGCNMHCAWCHNPETISASKSLLYNSDRCIGCMRCISACKYGAHMVVDGRHVIDREKCTLCGACVYECATGALEMSGREMSVSEVMREVLQDKEYYSTSNGGVTVTGGEVLCNTEFATALARACHENGISVAIETNLSFPYDRIKKLIDSVDDIMCDLKIFDEEAHIAHTGHGNAMVKENIRRLSAEGRTFTVRTPLIPRATDSDENIRAIGEFLAKLKGIERWELLNFNPLGASKYAGLSIENRYACEIPLTKSRCEELCSIAKGYVKDVRVV